MTSIYTKLLVDHSHMGFKKEALTFFKEQQPLFGEAIKLFCNGIPCLFHNQRKRKNLPPVHICIDFHLVWWLPCKDGLIKLNKNLNCM